MTLRARLTLALLQRRRQAAFDVRLAQSRERTRRGGLGCSRPGRRPHAGAAGVRALTRAQVSHTIPPIAIATGTMSTARPRDPTSDR